MFDSLGLLYVNPVVILLPVLSLYFLGSLRPSHGRS